MKNIITVALLAALLLAAPSRAFAKMKASVDTATLIGMLSSAYDKGQFTGVYSLTVFHTKATKLKIAVDNSDGKRVFENVYNCESNGDSDNPSCYIDTDKSGKPAPYSVRTGVHTLRIFDGADEIFTFKYKLTTKMEYEYKNVYMTGDWYNLAAITTGGIAYITIYAGDPASCAPADVYDPQVQLFKDGNYIGKGHYSPNTAPFCSTSGLDFTMFSEDANHLTKWINASDILSTDGNYEIKYFERGKFVRAFAFSVADGKVTSSPSADKPVQEALSPEYLKSPYQSSVWIYAK